MTPVALFSNTSFSSQLTNGPMKVECFTVASFFQASVSNTLASYTRLLFTKEMKCCEYNSWGFIHKHFIFFTTYKWTHEGRVFCRGKLFQPSGMQHSSLLGLFISYKENEVLGIQPRARIHYISFYRYNLI